MNELDPEDLENLEFAEIFEEDPDAMKVLCDASCLFDLQEDDIFPTVRYNTVKFVANLINRGDYIVIFNDSILDDERLTTTLHKLGVAFNHTSGLKNRLAACQEEAVDLVMTTCAEEAQALRGSYKVVLLTIDDGVENITDCDSIKTDSVKVVEDLEPIQRITKPTTAAQRLKLRQLCIDNPTYMAFTPLLEDVDTLLSLVEQLLQFLPEDVAAEIDEVLGAFGYEKTYEV